MPAQFKDPDKAEQILNAAYTVVARQGFTRATISEIADEAEMSRGLLHYYFKNKEDIMARVAGVSSTVSLGLIDGLFQGDCSPEALAGRYCAALESITGGDRDFISVMIESWSVSRRSEAVRSVVLDNYRRFRERIAGELARLEEQGKVFLLLPPGETAAILAGIFDGVGLQIALEPDLADRMDLMGRIRALVAVLLGGAV